MIVKLHFSPYRKFTHQGVSETHTEWDLFVVDYEIGFHPRVDELMYFNDEEIKQFINKFNEAFENTNKLYKSNFDFIKEYNLNYYFEECFVVRTVAYSSGNLELLITHL